MTLPAPLRAGVDAALEAQGHGRVTQASPVGGGCISETARLRTSTGASFFLKWSDGDASAGIFRAEAYSLGRLAATRTLRVPAVLAVSDPETDPGDRARGVSMAPEPRWLLLEWLEPGSATRTTWEQLGARLAALHRVRGDVDYGWPADNFIGTLSQSNSPSSSWSDFWRDRRLRPQLELALAGAAFGAAEVARFDALFAALDDILAPASEEGPSMVHGDLWSGNLHVLASGEPALIDPSSYFGHREVDLAMAQLFGGFDDRFLHAYQEAWPLADGFSDLRRPAYQLYYLLVHVNLFGGAYRAAALNALRATGH